MHKTRVWFQIRPSYFSPSPETLFITPTSPLTLQQLVFPRGYLYNLITPVVGLELVIEVKKKNNSLRFFSSFLCYDLTLKILVIPHIEFRANRKLNTSNYIFITGNAGNKNYHELIYSFH